MDCAKEKKTNWDFYFHLLAGLQHGGPEEQQRYSSTLSLTSTLDGMGGQPHAPTALPREMNR